MPVHKTSMAYLHNVYSIRDYSDFSTILTIMNDFFRRISYGNRRRSLEKTG